MAALPPPPPPPVPPPPLPPLPPLPPENLHASRPPVNGPTGSQSIPPPPPPPPPPTLQPTVDRQQRKQEEEKRRRDKEKRDKEKRDKERREKEKRDKEKAAKAAAAAAAANANAAATAAAGPGGRLWRETPFLAHIRFKNDLPQIPCDPKMLVAQIHPDRLAQFALTSLERGMRRDLVVPPDVGVPLSLLDSERYALPDTRADLDPADAKLLGDEDGKDLGSAAAASVAAAVTRRPAAASGHLSRARAQKAEVSWLMRTTYISNDSGGDLSRRTGVSEKRAKALSQEAAAAREAPVLPEEAHERQIAQIEATFDAAQAPPVHATNPSLTAVEVLPVFPDFEAWGLRYLVARFDSDPAEEVEALSKNATDIRGKVGARCMLKGFKLDGGKKPNEPAAAAAEEKFMALLVPSTVDANAIREMEDDADVPPEALEGEYTWVKEYSYTLHRKTGVDASFFLRLKDGVASYCDVHADMDLKRRQGRAAEFQRTGKVTIRRRDPTDAEEQEREQRVRRLNHSQEEYE